MKQLQIGIYSFFCLCGLMTPGELKAEPESGEVTVAVGDVESVPRGGGNASPLEAGDKVAVGSTVKTGANSRAVIVITPRSAIRVSADSEVVIEAVDEEATPKQITIDLKSGGLGALLKPNAVGELDFKVRTPSGVAAARGTFFGVVVEDGKGYAQVKEGRIEIVPENQDGANQ
ncbi:MAG: FecR family protein [Verrucomicrobiales bacterium]